MKRCECNAIFANFLTLQRLCVTLLTFVYKNFLPTYFCTDISVNFTQESPVLQLPVEENRTVYHLHNPFYVRLCLKKSFLPQKGCALWWALLKKRKRFSLFLLTGYRYHKNFNRVPGDKGRRRHVKKISKICDEK